MDVNVDISGVPGIGKTLCVKNIINKFQANKGEAKLHFKYVYLNAMRIKKAHDIFKTLYVELTSHKERNSQVETAMFILDDLLDSQLYLLLILSCEGVRGSVIDFFFSFAFR